MRCGCVDVRQVEGDEKPSRQARADQWVQLGRSRHSLRPARAGNARLGFTSSVHEPIPSMSHITTVFSFLSLDRSNRSVE